jgi:hypothetical protein
MRLGTARTIDKGMLLATTLCLAGNQYDLPSKTFWETITNDRPYFMIVLIGLVSVLGGFPPFESLSQRIRIERQVAVRQQILTTFGQLLDIGRAIRPVAEVSDFGLHIWRKQRSLRHPWHGELDRVATYRLGSTPMNRAIRPIRGLGVVGLCWQQDREVGVNVEALAAKLSSEQEFNDYRRRNGAPSVMGFSWQEFQRFSHRGAVFASPVRNGRSAFVGCISFDAERGYDELNCHRMWHELNSLCIVLGQDGFQYV